MLTTYKPAGGLQDDMPPFKQTPGQAQQSIPGTELQEHSQLLLEILVAPATATPSVKLIHRHRHTHTHTHTHSVSKDAYR